MPKRHSGRTVAIGLAVVVTGVLALLALNFVRIDASRLAASAAPLVDPDTLEHLRGLGYVN
jgi:hypothetical protein